MQIQYSCAYIIYARVLIDKYKDKDKKYKKKESTSSTRKKTAVAAVDLIFYFLFFTFSKTVSGPRSPRAQGAWKSSTNFKSSISCFPKDKLLPSESLPFVWLELIFYKAGAYLLQSQCLAIANSGRSPIFIAQEFNRPRTSGRDPLALLTLLSVHRQGSCALPSKPPHSVRCRSALLSSHSPSISSTDW